MALILCFVSIVGFGQITAEVSTQFSDLAYSDTVYSIGYDKLFHIINNGEKLNSISFVPETIVCNYKIGQKCYTAGAAIVSVGTLCLVPGILLSAVGSTLDAKQIGYGFLSVSGTLVGISIPLLCFGDHIKRETNMVYDVWSSLEYKNQ